MKRIRGLSTRIWPFTPVGAQYRDTELSRAPLAGLRVAVLIGQDFENAVQFSFYVKQFSPQAHSSAT